MKIYGVGGFVETKTVVKTNRAIGGFSAKYSLKKYSIRGACPKENVPNCGKSP